MSSSLPPYEIVKKDQWAAYLPCSIIGLLVLSLERCLGLLISYLFQRHVNNDLGQLLHWLGS